MIEPLFIAGAGPAGMTAAIVLRRHGIPVGIYEKFPDVGYRLHGDFQLIRELKLRTGRYSTFAGQN